MPRLNIIILDKTTEDNNTYRFAMWADVPVARQSHYANATTVSAWIGATAQDNTNLQSGTVVETVTTQRVPSAATLAQIEAFLQSQWSAYQAAVSANNPWVRYGSTWDGTTWTVLNNG